MGRVRLQDGRRPTIYGETKEEVRLAIQRIGTAEADGKPIVVTAERLKDLFELWIRESVSKKRLKTATSYESEARRNLLPLLGGKRLGLESSSSVTARLGQVRSAAALARCAPPASGAPPVAGVYPEKLQSG